MIFIEFRDDDYTTFRKNLIKEKGSSLQLEFIKEARNSLSFVNWIETKIGIEDKGNPLVLWATPISDSDYRDLPTSIERQLFDAWKSITPAQASQETFWGYVTLQHIKQGIVEATHLAADNNGLLNGLGRIDNALTGRDKSTIDSVVRSILRRLGGLPEARGSKSVYVNCPFARAWWRGYVAKQVCEETDADPDKVIETLRHSQEYWEQLIVLIVSRNSVLGDTNVRTALIWALSELVSDGRDNGDNKKYFQGATIKKISRQIGVRAAWQELGVFPVRELKPIIEQEFLSTV